MIPKLRSALYRMKKIAGEPVILIGITGKTYDRQNRTAVVTHDRIFVRRGIINPVYHTLTDMLGRSQGGSITKVSAYVIIDISDLPVSFDRQSVQYINYQGQTYNVETKETVEENKAMIYTLTGVAHDYRFILEQEIEQNVELSQDIET